MRSPLPILLTGYAVAGAGGVLVAATGGGLAAAMLVAWIGGAVCVVALAFRRHPRRSEADLCEATDLDAPAASLLRWETDRRNEAAEAQTATASVGARPTPK